MGPLEIAVSDHDRAFELLPWLVNGTLEADESAFVEAHVRDCVTCRIALREQHQLRAAVSEQPTVPLSPTRGLEALQRELERRSHPRQPRRLAAAFAPRAAFAAAALGTAAVILVGWLAVTGTFDRERADYVTLTSSGPSDGVELDLIFATSISENDLRALLTGIEGTIVGGPSELGRYTVRLAGGERSETEIAALVERLGRDPRVRFAGRSLAQSGP